MKKQPTMIDDIHFLTDQNLEQTNYEADFQGNLEEWTSHVTTETVEKLSTDHPVIIALAGPSCGGKGEATERLTKNLTKQNKKVLNFSTDHFYKGISQMIMEKILPDYPTIPKNSYPQIFAQVRDIIKNSPFDQKFSAQNLSKIEQNLSKEFNLPTAILSEIKTKIITEFSKIDFDTPEAVNLNEVAKFLENFKKGIPTTLPSYSMKQSEPVTGTNIDPKDFDLAIMEGIYALHPSLTKLAHLKSFIEVPNHVHLLLRRLFRDVVGPNARSSFTPETALMINLRIVMPAAIKHILPTRAHADSICQNPHTLPEAVNTSYCEVQDKIKTSKSELPIIWKKIIEHENYKLIDKTNQTDYYLVDQKMTAPDKEDYQKYILRLREEKDQIDLVYKGPRFLNTKNKIIRPAETLIKKEEFGTHYHNATELLADFEKAGFKTLATISKKRMTFQKNGVILIIDHVDKLGYYIEFITDSEKNIPAINKLKKELGLDQHTSVGPYIDQMVQNQAL